MAWDKYFLEGLQSGAELATKRKQLEEQEYQNALELYLKSQPANYTYTDPTTGETKSYTVQSSMSDDIKTALEERILSKLKNVKGIKPPSISSKGVSSIDTKLPPGVSTFQQGGKTQIIKGVGGSKDSPAVEAQKTISGTRRFLEQFGRSYNELKNYDPEFDKLGYEGWMSRKGASINNYFDVLPETKAFQVELKPLANQMARDVEGGRVTDQDRQIYADAFANTLQHPSETNIRLSSNALIKLKDKGGNINTVVSELYSSDMPIMQKIASEVLKSYPELRKDILLQVYQNNPNRFEVVNE
jgi:hypothetical protein